MTVVTLIVTKEHSMIAVAKGKLKAHMLEYFRRVEESGEELVVTDNRVPVLRVVPYRRKLAPEEAFGDLRGRVKYNGDIAEPETGEWLEK
jgi:antitoxin (DNA-binding transcriptional repressor) of toxin-antitoxin stability system